MKAMTKVQIETEPVVFNWQIYLRYSVMYTLFLLICSGTLMLVAIPKLDKLDTNVLRSANITADVAQDCEMACPKTFDCSSWSDCIFKNQDACGQVAIVCSEEYSAAIRELLDIHKLAAKSSNINYKSSTDKVSSAISCLDVLLNLNLMLTIVAFGLVLKMKSPKRSESSSIEFPVPSGKEVRIAHKPVGTTQQRKEALMLGTCNFEVAEKSKLETVTVDA